MELEAQQKISHAQGLQIQELQQSVQFLSRNFQEAADKYNGFVEAYGTREMAVNDTLADHQVQVSKTPWLKGSALIPLVVVEPSRRLLLRCC